MLSFPFIIWLFHNPYQLSNAGSHYQATRDEVKFIMKLQVRNLEMVKE